MKFEYYKCFGCGWRGVTPEASPTCPDCHAPMIKVEDAGERAEIDRRLKEKLAPVWGKGPVRQENLDRKKQEGQVKSEKGTIETAGVRWHAVGKNGRFRHRVQVPWIFLFKMPQDAKTIMRRLNENKFTVIEKIEMEGLTTSHVVDTKSAESFDLAFDDKRVCVYPTSNKHQEASKRLWELFDAIDAQGR